MESLLKTKHSFGSRNERTAIDTPCTGREPRQRSNQRRCFKTSVSDSIHDGAVCAFAGDGVDTALRCGRSLHRYRQGAAVAAGG